MISASLYITACSTKNRIRMRLRRLREPRYLIGAVVGSAYLYFSLFAGRRGRRNRGDGRPPLALLDTWQVAGTSLAAMGVFVLAALSWLLPPRAVLLEFSPAETSFLFPAPVSRRELLLHRIIRSQVSSLLAALVLGIFLAPNGGLGRVRFSVAMWVLFLTVRIYFAAVALTQAQFASPRQSVRLAAWLPVSVLSAGLVVLVVAVSRQMALQPVASASDFLVRLSGAASTGLAGVVLWPFAALLRPQFARDTAAYFQSLAGSLAVLGVVTAWMLVNDGAFERVATEASERRAIERPSRKATITARQGGPALALTGRAEWAIFWKNGMHTFRSINLGTMRYVAPLAVGLVGVTTMLMALNHLRGPAGVFGGLAVAVAVMAVLLGPMMTRLDLRGDFAHLELLKTWPLRAPELIRGEMAWPVTAVTLVAWGGILCALLVSGTAMPDVVAVRRWTLAVSALLAAPALIAAQYTVHNAMALFFPAWLSLGGQRVRGIDAMGQQLIMLAAVLLSLAVFALPGAIAGGIVWFVLRGVMGASVFVPASAVAAAVVLIEVIAATELLGPAYDRLDMTSVERPE